jgi:hypothetical protein
MTDEQKTTLSFVGWVKVSFLRIGDEAEAKCLFKEESRIEALSLFCES